MAYITLGEQSLSEIIQQFGNWVETSVREAGEKFLTELNSDLLNAQKGQRIHTLVVFGHVGRTIELQFRGPVSLGFANGFAKVRFTMDDQVYKEPEHVRNVKLTAAAGEFVLSRKAYEIAVGYGYDPGYQSTRAKVSLKTPDLTIDAFLAGTNDGAFVVDFGVGTSNDGPSKFPLVIPLGATGFAFQGIGGTVAHNFRPHLKPDEPEDPTAPTALDYVNWAHEHARKAIDGWRPVRKGESAAGGIGLRSDFIDLPTNGFLLRIKDAGFLALSEGPVVVTGGRAQLLNLPVTNVRIQKVAALDFGSLSYAIQGTASLKIPGEEDANWEVISGQGVLTAQMSLLNSRAWFLNIGTDGSPIRGSFLKDVFSASVFFMVNSDRIFTGAKVSFGGRSIEFLGVALDAFFSLETRAKIGFQPIHFEGTLIIAGGVVINLWGIKVGVELSALVAIAILKPLQLRVEGGWKISLPWPLPDISGTLTLVNESRNELPEIALPILLKEALKAGKFGGPSDQRTQQLGALHTLTGLQFDINNDKSAIWPDCELAIPFARKVTDLTGKIIEPSINSYRDGQVTVEHLLRKLELVHVRKDSGGQEVEAEVPNVRGVWVAAPAAKNGDANSPTARLHFPANDPFRWLDEYQNRESSSHLLEPVGVELDFGVGSAELQLRDLLVPPLRMTRISGGLDVVSEQGMPLKTRTARMMDCRFEVRDPESSSPRLLSKAILTFASYDAADFGRLTSNRQLRVVAVNRTSGTGLLPFYMGRVQISLPANASFSDFEIFFKGESHCVEGIGGVEAAVCRSTISLYKVTLFGPNVTSVTWQEKTILQPGTYRIRAAGDSIWSVPNNQERGQWTFSQQFEVVPPTSLAPYMAHITIGDERPYRMRGMGIWNPTPSGIGFPRYTSHVGNIVFRPDYVSRIFPMLEVSFGRDLSNKSSYSVTRNENGERFESEASAKWALDVSGHYGVADELLFDVPPEKGQGEVQIGFRKSDGAYAKLAEWAYESSAFEGPEQHLELHPPIVRLARSVLEHVDSPASAKEALQLDIGSVTKPPETPMNIPTNWRLPLKLLPRFPAFDPKATLDFLRFAERTSIRISTISSDPLQGIVERSDESVVESFTDREGRAYAFWMRTPEPFDWRRLSAVATVFAYSRGASGSLQLLDEAPLQFTLVFIPSPDGASSLVLAKARETYVRLPMGVYSVDLRYLLKRDNLPHLRLKGNSKAEEVAFRSRLINPFGRRFGR